MTTRPTTLGELRDSPWGTPEHRQRTVRDEIRHNLMARLERGEPIFPGIVGYDDSVVPQVINALLAEHHFILLGLRGQAKSRILRQLTTLLDEFMPIIAGSEINDHPLRPISKYGRQLVEEQGDATPITWVDRDSRYVEKLATPDVTIADIIGDLDPIKAARGGHLLSDELTIHYGLLPRSNRGIFALNELPDLAGKIQVGLFNILQEGDIQIKGYPIRLPLDILLVFSANPEDYTARGKIITPLKDRIGSEIQTHYPQTVEHGMQITAQEAHTDGSGLEVEIPYFLPEVIERIAFLARGDKRIDHRSGVSQRLPITVMEATVANATRRTIVNREKKVVPRISDLFAALPAITGKLELEYEGELQGGDRIARELVTEAVGEVFDHLVGATECDMIVEWFDEGAALKVAPDERADVCVRGFAVIPQLFTLLEDCNLAPSKDPPAVVTGCELVLEGLVARQRITCNSEGGYQRSFPANYGYGSGTESGPPPTDPFI